MTVTTRIYSGFAISLLLSIVLFLVARTSVNNINTGIDKLSSQSVPILISAANLSKSVLTSELVLKQLITADKLSEAMLLSERFTEVQAVNQTSIINLGNQLNTLPEFVELFTQVEKANAQLYGIANKGIEQLLNVLKQIEITAKLTREFGDMGDESLSFAYDLESMAEDQQTVDDIARFVELIEVTVGTANQALKSNLAFEIMGLSKEVETSLKDISTLLTTLQSSYELKGSDELIAMVDNIQQFKGALSGDNSAIKSKINNLKSFSKVKKEFELSATQANTMQTLLIELNHKIEVYTDGVKQSASGIVADSQLTLIILVLLIVILSLVMSFLVTRSICYPLKQVVEKLKIAATGDMTVQFDNKRKDELGDMADCMQQLLNSLRNALQEIANNSHLLASTAEETSTIADMSFASANQQQQQMEAMSSSISQMTETVSSVSQSVNVTLSQVEQVNMQAKQGESVLLENTESIIQLGNTIEESAKVIQSLNDDTMNISSVLSEIKGIAEQTNLLALNAAIEAARAGEQGRGFAVVADEVRSLASRTQDSTQEIQSAIEHLVEGAGRSVDSMKESQDASQNCVVGSNKVKDMLHNIVESIQSIRDMSQQIASASEQQTIAAQSQLTSVNDINDITEQTAVRARENQEASQQLAEMAEAQRALLNRFKT